MADGASEEVKPIRVPGKRTAKKSVEKTDGSLPVSRKRATRTRATRKADEPAVKKEKPKAEKVVVTPDPVEVPARKAPTPLSAEAKEKRAAKKRLAIMTLIILAGVGGSAMVGYTDDGQIDINKTIDARNERVRQSGSGELIIPVQNTSQQVDGGLIGRGVGTPKATTTEEVSETETASTTASSTTDVGEAPLSQSEIESDEVQEEGEVTPSEDS